MNISRVLRQVKNHPKSVSVRHFTITGSLISNFSRIISTRLSLPITFKCGLQTFDAEKYTSNNVEENTTIRPKLRVKHILQKLRPKNYALSQNSTIPEAINFLVTEHLSSALAMSEEGEISGIFTANDVIRFIKEKSLVANQRNIHDPLLKTKVYEIMTPKEKLIYCSPDDTVKRCREIMFQCHIENMPIIEHGEVLGIITLKNLADSSFNIAETGGKKGFIHNVTGRKGLPSGARPKTSTDPTGSGSSLLMHLDIEIGSYALPHPFKRSDGVAMSRRLYGAHELSTDMSVCEDAHFIMRVKDPLAIIKAKEEEGLSSDEAHHNEDEFGSGHREGGESRPEGGLLSENSNSGELTVGMDVVKTNTPSQVYMCVADGVGNWRQYGIDPREYSHRLVENARKVIEADVLHRELIGDSPFDRGLDPIHPLDVIMDAWNLTTADAVNGSSTMCVATLDKKLNQISYSNIGDCGLIVVRHIDSETGGYMHERQRPKHLRDIDLRVSYLSQQQLKSFNLPYQLGYIDPNVSTGHFESPTDADTASIPVSPGDIIILATDGLFDNMDLDEIVEEIALWEEQYFGAPIKPSETGNLQQHGSLGVGSVFTLDPLNNTVLDVIQQRRLPLENGAEAMQHLAQRLVTKARELSLDKQRDSPFALLAKENDIMWGGGMPDDTTVVAGRIVHVE